MRDNDRGSKTSFDRTSSSVEVLRGDSSMASVLLSNEDNDGGDDTEKCTETNDNGPTNSLRKWCITTEERVRALVFQEWWSRFGKYDRHDYSVLREKSTTIKFVDCP